MVNYLSCIEGKEIGKDTHCSAQNAGPFVNIKYLLLRYLKYSYEYIKVPAI